MRNVGVKNIVGYIAGGMICLAAAILFPPTKAQLPSDSQDDEYYEEIRINPDTTYLNAKIPEWQGSMEQLAAKYRFLNPDGDTLRMNGADWSRLAAKLFNTQGVGEPSVIVHIGDSHLQPDISSGKVRKLMQEVYGSAGRGLVIPYRMAGTNQPDDYSITSDVSHRSSKLMDKQPAVSPGFTGISVSPMSSAASYSIRSGEVFEQVDIYYSGPAPRLAHVYDGDEEIGAVLETLEPGVSTLMLHQPCSSIKLRLGFPQPTTIYGFNLRSDSEGLLYHSIGNNGATVSSYLGIEGFEQRIASLEPDLVIVSLGTNEAHGGSPGDISSHLRNLIRKIKKETPMTEILLTTPTETQRRKTTRRRGRRRYSYSPNSKIAIVRDAIVETGRNENVAVLDLYEICGGEGSSAKWFGAGLLSKDRIHKTRTGYSVEGQLLFNALNNTFLSYTTLKNKKQQ